MISGRVLVVVLAVLTLGVAGPSVGSDAPAALPDGVRIEAPKSGFYDHREPVEVRFVSERPGAQELRAVVRASSSGAQQTWTTLLDQTEVSDGTSPDPLVVDFTVPVTVDRFYDYELTLEHRQDGVVSRQVHERLYGNYTGDAKTYTFETEMRVDQRRLETKVGGRPLLLTGRLTSDHPDRWAVAGRVVHLSLDVTQRGHRHPIGEVTTAADGSFRARVPSHFAYRRGVVAFTPSIQRSVERPDDPGRDTEFVHGGSASRAVVVRASLGYRPRGTSRQWAYLRNGPTSYDACSRLTYRVNPRGLPRGARGMLRDVLAQASEATGYRFVDRGATRQVPGGRGQRGGLDLRSNLTFAWATPKQVPRLAGGVVGLGGPGGFRGGFATRGAAVFDRGPWLDTAPAAERRDLLHALITHEIGHVLGLGHVAPSSQTMHPSLLLSHRGRFEKGDLAGLERNGTGRRGCAGASERRVSPRGTGDDVVLVP